MQVSIVFNNDNPVHLHGTTVQRLVEFEVTFTGMGVKFGCNFMQSAHKQASAQGYHNKSNIIIKLKLLPAAGCKATVAA